MQRRANAAVRILNEPDKLPNKSVMRFYDVDGIVPTYLYLRNIITRYGQNIKGKR